MQQALDAEATAAQITAGHADRDRCVVLGRGYAYASAREWALKLQEMALLMSHPFSTADFEHGPLALAESGFAVLAVAPSGPPLDAQREVLERLRRDLGARLLVISDDRAVLDLDQGLPLPEGVPGWLSPIGRDNPGPAVRLSPDPQPRPRPRSSANHQQGHRDALSPLKSAAHTRDDVCHSTAGHRTRPRPSTEPCEPEASVFLEHGPLASPR